MKILVTGGAGFIGSAVCRLLVGEIGATVLNVDKLTYAANLASLRPIENDPHYRFRRADICDRPADRASCCDLSRPTRSLHLAAESHVDRSIDGPGEFIRTNIEGTYALLEAALDYWRALPAERAGAVPLSPRLDRRGVRLARPRGQIQRRRAAISRILPMPRRRRPPITWCGPGTRPSACRLCISNCSNNYGPYHFPEKLIPLAILKALHGEPIPVYGKGDNVRDWLYVEDHARALHAVLTEGRPGESYNIGGDGERTNLEVVTAICALLDEMLPNSPHRPHEQLITFVADRPGHDRRYAMDAAKIRARAGLAAARELESGLRKTVAWYLENRWWWEPIWSERYRGTRLGTGRAGRGRRWASCEDSR